jgi:hypothetical protein
MREDALKQQHSCRLRLRSRCIAKSFTSSFREEYTTRPKLQKHLLLRLWVPSGKFAGPILKPFLCVLTDDFLSPSCGGFTPMSNVDKVNVRKLELSQGFERKARCASGVSSALAKRGQPSQSDCLHHRGELEAFMLQLWAPSQRSRANFDMSTDEFFSYYFLVV